MNLRNVIGILIGLSSACALAATPISPVFSGKHGSAVNSVNVSPDQSFCISGSDDGTVGIWPISEERSRLSLRVGSPVLSTAISPDGKVVLAGTKAGDVLAWTRDGRMLFSVRAHAAPVSVIRYSPDGTYFATGSGGADGDAKIWSVAGDERVIIKAPLLDSSGNTLSSNSAGIQNIQISSDGNKIFVHDGYDGLSTIVWSREGQLLQRFSSSWHQTGFAVSPDAKTIAVAGPSGKNLTIYELGTGKIRSSVSLEEAAEFLLSSPFGDRFAVGMFAKGIRIFDWKGTLLAKSNVDDTGWFAADASASSDGKLFFTASGDRVARLWDWNGEVRAVLVGFGNPGAWPLASAFSPDGRFLITGDNDSPTFSPSSGYLRKWQLRGIRVAPGLH